MHRFFVSPAQVGEQFITVTGEDVKHISKVLRLREGDEIVLCDGDCTEYRAEITSLEKNEVTARILEKSASLTEPSVQLTIFQGLPKAGKLETVIQKGTEIGVSRFVPFDCSRAVVKPWSAQDDKCVRYQRVALEAAKQSRRGRVPVVAAPVKFAALCEQAGAQELALVAWEDEHALSLKQALRQAKAEGKKLARIAVVIGPEGGISSEEAKALKAAGALPVSLGRRILRTETAGMAAAAMILYEMDEMEP